MIYTVLLVVFFHLIYLSEGGIYLGLLNTGLLEVGMELNATSGKLLYMVVLCGTFALPFCGHYMGSLSTGSRLEVIMVVFLVIMCSLILSGTALTYLILWEFLGICSFFLIIFNRGMYSSRASMVTFVSSRLGDVGLALYVGYMVTTNSVYDEVGFLLVLGILTKSASYPFVSWLIQAMRAPTPVSCLVHSSTLVAAGIWLGTSANHEIGSGVSYVLVVCSLITIYVTGLVSLGIGDLKQVVAFSTCNNIAWCVLSLGVGIINTCLVLLLTHGVLKCLLFTSVGNLFSSSNHSQSFLSVSGIGSAYRSSTFSLSSLVVSLSGFPALGIFMTKHSLFYACLECGNSVLCVFVLIGIFFSYLYSFRLISVLLCPGLCSPSTYIFSFIASFVLSLFPSLINIAVEEVSTPSYFYSGDEDNLSLVLVGAQLLGALVGYWVSKSSLISGLSLSYYSCQDIVWVSNFVFFLGWSYNALWNSKLELTLLRFISLSVIGGCNLLRNNLVTVSCISLMVLLVHIYILLGVSL